MSVNIHTVEFERRDAYLSELDERPPYTVHGVALGSNDVTVGQSGIKKLWPAEALEKSADTLQGRSLVVDHNNSSDGVVGQVTKAGYKDGTGVIYEAELFDKELAEKISNGLLEVSIRGKHSDVDNMEENDDGAKIVRDIVFDNLSIVPTGAAPSNTISIGETAELSVAQLSRFMSQLQEIDPGMWVESDDIKGITISQIRDGQVEVDIYEESDGTWRSTEETKMMSTNDLSEWDVDEDNVGGAQKDEELIGISSVPDNLRFVSKQDAMDFAEQQQILTGVHQVDDIWVPGDNHDQFIKWTRSQERKDIGNNPLRKNSVLSEGASFSRGDWVNWNTRNSTEIGKVIGGYMEGDDLPDIRGDRGLSPEGDDVLYTLRMYKKRDGTWHPISGDPIAHYERSVRAADKPSDVSNTYVELGRSNVSQYDVEAEQWVQWYPTDTTEAHGFSVSVDDDSVEIEKWHQNSDGKWATYGDTVMKDMEEVEPWGNFPREQEDFSDAIEDGDPRKNPAKGPQRREGSDVNPEGSAASASAEQLDEDITFSDSIEKGLKNKVKEHNEEHGDEEGKRVTYRMLKSVYRRGAGAYSDSHREGMTRQQWSYARVNAFLYLVRNGNPENDNYTQDNDLLPDEHPKYSDAEENSVTTADSISQDAYGLHNPMGSGVEEPPQKIEQDVLDAELASDMSELDEVYSEWSETVNMTASELERWSGHPCSREASLNPVAVIERNLTLLKENKSDWDESHIEDAKRTISFVKRMRGARGDGEQKTSGTHGCPTNWAISLMNWAFNPFDEIPSVPENDNLNEVSQVELMSMIREGMRFFSTVNHTMVRITNVEGDLASVMSGSDSQWIEQKEDIIEKVAEGDWKYAGHSMGPMMEQMAENMPSSPIPMPEEAQLLYPTKEKAMAAAEKMGMMGSHSHMLDGDRWHMPGKSHEMFVERMMDMGDMEGLAEAEMVLASYSENGYHGMDEEEEMAMNMPSSPIPMPKDAQLLYPTEEKAMAAAEKMGMMGSHSHMLDGDRWYMPGKSHEMFVERMMEMGDMEGLAEAEMVLASYSENGYHGMDEEEMSKHMSSSPIPMPEDAQLLYPTEKKAMAAADEMGIMGSHSHMLNGEMWYMPGKSHEMFVERMMEMGDMERLAEAEMVLASYSENGYHGADDDEDEDMESQMMGRTEFSDGDMVQWDVMPSLYGQVVHNPEDDPVIMVEIMENDNGMMKTTHHTISAYPSDIRMMRGMDELQSIEAHMPEFTGTTESDWSSPDMEDFDTDDMSEIAKHYLVSKSGFPPENFGDLALPVVGPEGDLYLNALQNAKARGSQVSGLSGDMLDEVMSMINSLANDNFESADFEEMKIGGGVPRKTTSLVRVLTGDDLWQSDGETKESEMDEIATKVTNMNDDIEQKLAELNEPVAVEQDDLEELQEKADRFSEMSSTLEALKERTDILDSVDREQVEELAEAEEPVVVESARMETLSEEAEQVAETYASELASESFLTAEELTDKFTIGELREKYEEQIGNPAEELASSEDAEPKSGDVDEEELQERAGSDEEELSSESDEAEQMREELRNKILG